jgi:uncharacterized protein involved in tolerance to divalent cations
MRVLVATCTFPEHEIAWRISRDAVEKGFAACATLIPEAKSIYRWKSQIETANETAVVFKTTEDQFETLQNYCSERTSLRSAGIRGLAGDRWFAGIPRLGGHKYQREQIGAERLGLACRR